MIDIHTHSYPGNVCEKVMGYLAELSGKTPVGDGTFEKLVQYGKNDVIDTCVMLNIAAKPEYVEDVNDYSEQCGRTPGIVAFGSVHPYGADIGAQIDGIKKRGLCGIKLHPASQHIDILDDRSDYMFAAIESSGLPVLMHSGWDPLDMEAKLARPQDEAEILRRHPHLKMILAHLGGMCVWDDVEEYLVGRDVWFDTANCSRFVGDMATYERILKRHGADRVLLGSDYPWERATDEIAVLEKFGLSDGDMEKICDKNARRLLGL